MFQDIASSNQNQANILFTEIRSGKILALNLKD